MDITRCYGTDGIGYCSISAKCLRFVDYADVKDMMSIFDYVPYDFNLRLCNYYEDKEKYKGGVDMADNKSIEDEFEEVKNSVDDFKCKSIEEALDLAYQILWDYCMDAYGDNVGDIAVKVTVPVDGKVFTKSWSDREDMLIDRENKERGLLDEE